MTGHSLERPSADSGWTFVEAIVVIAIVLLLSGTVAVSAVRHIERARLAAADTELSAIRIGLQTYFIDNGMYPTEAQGLAALWARPSLHPTPAAWDGPYVSRAVEVDPWGNHYVYDVVPGEGYTVTSFGADGLPGGTGNYADRQVTQ